MATRHTYPRTPAGTRSCLCGRHLYDGFADRPECSDCAALGRGGDIGAARVARAAATARQAAEAARLAAPRPPAGRRCLLGHEGCYSEACAEEAGIRGWA